MPREKMRNFGKFLKGYLALLVMAIGFCIAMSSCQYFRSSQPEEENVPELSIEEQISAVTNPTFGGVTEVFAYRADCFNNQRTDSVFMDLPDAVLSNVCNVLIKRGMLLTKENIVGEYKSNKSVYDNLPPGPGPQSNNSSDATKPNGPDNSAQAGAHHDPGDIISTSYSYRTDTAKDGKLRKVQIRKEERYVE